MRTKTITRKRNQEREKLRQMRRSAKSNEEAFIGKLALLQTYEEMNIPAPYDLKKRVCDKRTQLKYRGAL